jgi:SAM-dependent methyltransferase
MAEFTPDRIMQFVWGFAPTLILEAAIKNNVFDTLDSGPRSIAQVAAATGASERGLRAIMNALVALDLIDKEGTDLYALTPESSAFLVSTKPGFQGAILKHMSRRMIPNWLQLPEIVRTGTPSTAVNREESADFFRQFVEDIFGMSWPAAQALAGALGIRNSKQPLRVLDIAAGSGVWSIALAQASQHVQVTALDWSLVLPVTQRVAARHGVADRYRFIEGDLATTDFGDDYHIALLGHILHSEGEVRSRALISKVYESLAPGGTIAIGEMVPNDDRTGPPGPLLFAVNMLVHTEVGDTFTFGEMRAWLEEAGFVNARTLEAPGIVTLVLATKPA